MASKYLTLFTVFFLCFLAVVAAKNNKKHKNQTNVDDDEANGPKNFTFHYNDTMAKNLTEWADALLLGLDAQTLISGNATDCVHRAIMFYYYDLVDYERMIKNGTFENILFNTSHMLKNLSLDLMVCTDVLHDTLNFTKS